MKIQPIKMDNIVKICVIFLLFGMLILGSASASELNREQMREKYFQMVLCGQSQTESDGQHGAGEDCIGCEAAVRQINFIRYLAGLDGVSLSAELSEQAQYAASLTAANGTLSHTPERPQGMDGEVYRRGSEAAASCNLICFNWNGNDLHTEAVVEFARDEGENNQFVLGHRRWLLYPYMKYTGFGMAQDECGRSYISMYVMDDSAQGIDYDMICYPSRGAFPAEYMSRETPWSVSFNPSKYDLMNSTPYLILIERTSGAEFRFERLNTAQELSVDGAYFILSGGRYGDGAAYIFRPDLSEYDVLMYGYEQNQVWDVRIEGMKYIGGTPCEPIEYTVEMASLIPIEPAAVEISPRGRVMNVGERVYLSAQVIPQWADDLSVTWSSSDEWVAQVDEHGIVFANGRGRCEIIARSVNGREDRIVIEVR